MSVLLSEIINNHDKIVNDELYAYQTLVRIIENEDVESLVYYQSKGYDMNPRTSIFYTPAMHITENNTLDFIKLINEKGLNLHVIDIYGNNILHEESVASKELLGYYLSIGLNPYQEDFSGDNAFDYANYNDEVDSQYMKENSLHSEGLNRKTALNNKNYSLALKIAETEIYNLGGFEKLFAHLSVNSVREYLKQIYYIFLLNKKYTEANSLMTALCDDSKKEFFLEWLEYPFCYVAAFFIGDTNSVEKMIIENQLKTKQYAKDKSNLIAYILLKQMDEFDTSLVKSLEKDLVVLHEVTGSDFSQLAGLFIQKSPIEEARIINKIEGLIQLEKVYVEKTVINYYGLGLYYLSKQDYVNAEYMFSQCIILCEKEKECEWAEYIHSTVMIDFINQKK